MSRTKAVYAGSFDPIHFGHLDIIKRASQIFDLDVIVGNNSAKQYLLPIEQRAHLVRQMIAASSSEGRQLIDVHSMHVGLLANLAKHLGARVIVKGIRGFADYDYERMLHEISVSQVAEIETVLIPGSPAFQHISSSAIKELLKLDGDLQQYTSQEVIYTLKALRR